LQDDERVIPHLAAGIPAGEGDLLLARRLRLVQPYLPVDQGERGQGVLLDFGCGNGAQTFNFVPHFAWVVGLDIDAEFLARFRTIATERGLTSRVHPVRYAGLDIPLATAAIDCVISFAVLEHVADEALALHEIARVIKPGGTLIMSVPNRWWIFETHGANLPLLPWNRVPLVSWWPRKLHDRYARARIYEKCEIEEKISALGFELLASQYLTAPMDVVKWRPLQKSLRRLVFRNDSTRLPVLATEIMVVARKMTS
jgi:SAM-dependent methyltransferase